MMKLFLAFALLGGAASIKTPMDTTVTLIEELEKQVKEDGKNEQASFDEYACWCEKTMERKANDIATAKDLIAETNILIKKLKGEIASHGAEIEQLNKDIAQNQAAIQDATELRMKEHKEYMGDRTESEQCIGALEAAISVLTGAGTKSFLQGQGNMHEAELLSVVAGIRRALNHRVSTQTMSSTDIDTMRHFVSQPDDFVSKKAKAMSAAQVGQNPFGDYAPQSTQIQGILKGMYDAFTADLEKDNAEEADKQKSFEELIATKRQEQATLQATLQKQQTDSAAKNKKLSESEVLLDDTTSDMNADQDFFADTKSACESKAKEWSVRVRLRTEELNGMQEAIRILSSADAKKTFEASTSTFVQLSAVHKHTNTERSAEMRSKAFSQLRQLAANSKNMKLAKIALELKSGGHFDKVILMIDDMIALLRKEEQEDIDHRDRCENSQNANANQLDDLKHDIKKTEESLKRMNREKDQLDGDIKELEKHIAATKKDQQELLKMRNEDVKDFRQALKDDTDALSLLKQAIVALSKFYKRNKMPVPELIQKQPKYAEDPDKAPETSWSNGNYGGRKSESGGIIAILEMLAEDVEKEIKEGRADDADAQEKYLKQNGALQNTLDSQTETKANVETEKADLEEKIADYDKFKNEKKADKKAEDATEKSLNTDCAWVKTHFKSRREKRKVETQGLVDAKAFLAGVAAGNDPLPPPAA